MSDVSLLTAKDIKKLGHYESSSTAKAENLASLCNASTHPDADELRALLLKIPTWHWSAQGAMIASIPDIFKALAMTGLKKRSKKKE